MPVITDIKETKKGRFALFCDGEFVFSIDDETYFKSGLGRGDEISKDDLDDLRRKSDLQKAKDKAFSLLDIRDHTYYELFSKLCRHFDADTARYAADTALRLGYVDDARCAASLAREMCLSRLYSVRRAAGAMRERGLSAELIESALSPYADAEPQTLKKLTEKKYRGKDADKAFASLMRLGFDSRDIREALGRLTEDVWD